MREKFQQKMRFLRLFLNGDFSTKVIWLLKILHFWRWQIFHTPYQESMQFLEEFGNHYVADLHGENDHNTILNTISSNKLYYATQNS